MRSFIFALLTMFFWGLAPILGKLGLVSVNPTIALVLRSTVITVLLLAWLFISGSGGELLQVDLKSGTFIALEGIAASLLGHLAYYYALKYGEVSRISPLVAGFPLVTLLLAFLLLGERLSLNKIAGGILIIAGVILLKK